MDNLKYLGIHYLRQYAREIGVKSPTTLKKPELIEEIRKIMNKEKKPCEFNSRGRRPLIFIENEKIEKCNSCIYFEKIKKIDDFIFQLNELYKKFNN